MKDWLAEFSEKYAKKVGLPFICHIRSNIATKERIQYLAKAGAYSVVMGVETGNERIRNEVLKRGIRNDQIIQAARIVHDSNLKLFTGNMLGLPGTNLENDFETLKLNQIIKPDSTGQAILQPYPRTEIREYAAMHGSLIGGIDDMPPSMVHMSCIKMDPMHSRQVRNLQSLFAFLVQFPRFTTLSRILIKLPLSKLYSLLFNHIFNEILKSAFLYHDKPSLKYYMRTIVVPWIKKYWPGNKK